MKDSKLHFSKLWRSFASATVSLVVLLALFLPTIQAGEAAAIVAFANQREYMVADSDLVIKIGVGASLSGPLGALGQQELNAVQLAVTQTNAAGGIKVGGKVYTLAVVAKDSAHDPIQAVEAANELVNVGVVAVVGHTSSVECLAAQPIYNEAGIAMISPSCTLPDVTQSGYKTTFRTVTQDGTMGTLMATHIRASGFSRTSIVEDNIEGVAKVGDFYASTFTALGGTITGRHIISEPKEFTDTLTTIQAENPDTIVNFAFYANEELGEQVAGELSRIAYSLGMTDVVVALGTNNKNETFQTSYANAAGVTAAKSDIILALPRRIDEMPGWPTFLADYQAAGFDIPLDTVYAAFAYDAARIIIKAIKDANSTDPSVILKKIASTKNYAGVVGAYQGFDSKGDVIPQWARLDQFQGWVNVLTQP